MALEKLEWKEFFIDCGIPDEESETYADIFAKNRIQGVEYLSKELLQDLGVTVIGDRLAILKTAQVEEEVKPHRNPIEAADRDLDSKTSRYKPHNATLPPVKSEMTHPEFRKFRVDWTVFKRRTRLPVEQVAVELYSACENSVQNAIVNTCDNFFSLEEEAIISLIEQIVTKRSNPTVHRLNFSKLVQSESESISDYLVRLKSTARDCEFTCPNCKFDLMSVNVKDQMIRGIHNETLQTDILSKAGTLKSLEDIVKHAESFESAVIDQGKLQENGEAMRFGSDRSGFKGKKWFKQGQKSQSRKRTCKGCGSLSHSGLDRPASCPAWGKNCLNCGTPNHFASACQQLPKDKQEDSEADARALIAHVKYENDVFTSASNSNVTEIEATIKPINKGRNSSHKPKPSKIFPDSGASICLGGTRHLPQLGIDDKDLIPCRKRVNAVGGSTLTCKGWLPAEFTIGNHTTRQPLFICDKVDRIYFSRAGCTDVKILPESFPYPMDSQASVASAEEVISIPKRPEKLPYPPTEENIPKLKDYLVKQFKSLVFDKATPFKTMNCPPAHIHLKADAVPYATHSPIPIPLHWKGEVKDQLDRDVRDGVIEPVPIGEPVVWCSPMIVTAKKDGRPRRTVDLQRLNSQCLRETHHCEPPFKLASQVPPNTRKTVLDATDGYHAVPLDDESKPFTTFITEWGRFRYRRLPQGFLASGDAYTRRYDEIIKDVKDKVKWWDITKIRPTYVCATKDHVSEKLLFMFSCFVI